jgi:hypothetical protein
VAGLGEIMDLMQGNIIRLTHFEHTTENGSRVRYKAPKDQVFVLALLGEEPKLPKEQCELYDVEKAVKDIASGQSDQTVLPGDLTSMVVKELVGERS